MALISAPVATSFTPEEMEKFHLTEIPFNIPPILLTAHAKRRQRSPKLFPRLPLAIFQHICQYLSVRDLSSFIRCEREWTQEHAAILSAHKGLRAQIDGSTDLLRALTENPARGQNIVALQFKDLGYDCHESDVMEILNYLPNLKFLRARSLYPDKQDLYSAFRHLHENKNVSLQIDNLMKQGYINHVLINDPNEDNDTNPMLEAYHYLLQHAHVKKLCLTEHDKRAPRHVYPRRNVVLPSLEAIDLLTSAPNLPTLETLATRAPNLKTITLRELHKVHDNYELELKLTLSKLTPACLPNVEKIKILSEQGHFWEIKAHLIQKLFLAAPQLRVLYFHGRINGEIFTPFKANSLPHLRDLYLLLNNVTPKDARALCKAAPNLRTLSLRMAEIQKAKFLKKMKKPPLQHLREIYLHRFMIHRKYLEKLANTHPNLRSLTITVSQFSKNCSTLKAGSFPKVKHLFLSRCDGENSFESIIALVEAAPKLETCEIHKSHSSEDFSALNELYPNCEFIIKG